MHTKYFLPLMLFIPIGLISFFIYNHYIIFNFSMSPKQSEYALTHFKKKSCPVVLHFWNNNSWHTEKSFVLQSDDTADVIRQLVKQLLDIFEQEHLTDKQIAIEQVVLTAHDSQALISFDRNPLSKKSNTFGKLMLIESILKTLRENNIKVNDILFLAHYKPLNDAELDFSHPWPLYGFLNT